MSALLRLGLGALGLVLLALRGVAFFSSGALHGGFADQLQVLVTLPWGRAGVAEWAAAAFIACGVIVWREGGVRGLLLATPVLVLGHGWTALWLAWRLPRLSA
jgi:hypothetical protein